MKSFRIVPEIKMCDTFDEFIVHFGLNERDLILTDGFLRDNFVTPKNLPCHVVAQDDFGGGEPSSTKVNAILKEVSKFDYDRVIAIGGGTAIDISKILSLDGVDDLLAVFKGEKPAVRKRKLVIIPTTCGTGSEVTNISIVAFEELNTKFGLAKDELYADTAVLCPEFLKGLPYKVFIFSSVDALIHAIESYLSPKASDISRFFSVEAIKRILGGYVEMREKGAEHRKEIMDSFVLGSTYAGVAFGNAGCGLVHAMSYPLSGEYHIAHGEANHKMLMSVLHYYDKALPNGDIKSLYSLFAEILGCDEKDALNEFETLFNSLIERKPLSAYGADEAKLKEFAAQVVKTQQRLLANAYVPTSEEQMVEIYRPVL